jgi:hypothetical protein
MDYQIARNIRNRSLADVIAANLVAGESYSGAFTKGISQKSVARLTRIKEKFDPLNIAKFLTGGSNLAAASLGRMLGRSQRDIQYFAGTARPIGRNTTADRIGALPRGDGGSTLGILTDIFNFLKSNHENEKNRYELLNNRREEEDLEKEKRHKELIKSITGVGTGTINKQPKENDGSLFGSILETIRKMFESFKGLVQVMIEKSLDWLMGLKPFVSLLGGFAKNILSALPLKALVGTAAGPAAFAAALLGFVSFTGEKRKQIEADPFNPKFDNDAYALQLRGQAKSEKQGGEQLRRRAVRDMSASYVRELIGSNLNDQELVQETGKTRKELQEWLTANPKGMLRPINVPALPTTPAEPPIMPRMGPQQLESLVKENQTLNLPKAPAAAPVNNLTNVSQTQKNQSMIISKLDKISVRNPEETFQRMIYYSTRVV